MKYLPHIAVAVVILVAGIMLWQRYGPKQSDTPKPPPTAGNVPAVIAPKVTRGDPALPKPDNHTTGILRVVLPVDSTRPVVPREIFIYLNGDPAAPPLIKSDAPIRATFSPVVDPWLLLQARIMVGGSASNRGEVSPWGGLSGIRLWRHVDIGAGVDEGGIGAFVSYEFFREFNIGLSWYLVPFYDSDASVAVVVSYGF